ncbi:MAG: efflux RND transporter permease subunit, partial [Gemmatimonadales bacterium]
SLYVNQFPKNSRLWQVILQAEPDYRLDPKDIDQIYVRNDTGSMVPLSSVVKPNWTIAPPAVDHYNGYPAIPINGAAAPGSSSGEAMAAMENIVRNELPAGIGFEWSGQSLQEILSGQVLAPDRPEFGEERLDRPVPPFPARRRDVGEAIIVPTVADAGRRPGARLQVPLPVPFGERRQRLRGGGGVSSVLHVSIGAIAGGARRRDEDECDREALQG